jgi:hypothetical protein
MPTATPQLGLSILSPCSQLESDVISTSKLHTQIDAICHGEEECIVSPHIVATLRTDSARAIAERLAPAAGDYHPDLIMSDDLVVRRCRLNPG